MTVHRGFAKIDSWYAKNGGGAVHYGKYTFIFGVRDGRLFSLGEEYFWTCLIRQLQRYYIIGFYEGLERSSEEQRDR